MFRVCSVFFFVPVFVIVFTLLHHASVVAELTLCFIALWLTDYIIFKCKIPFLPMRIVPGHKYKAVLITGCDSVIGFEMARRLDNIGVKVFAGYLFPLGREALQLQRISSRNLKILKLDITNENDVKNALQEVTSSLSNKELWAVVNSAGALTFAETELCSLNNAQHVFQVNVMGTLRLTQAFLPLIRASRGRIIFVTGISGRITINGLVAYSMSKHAIVALADGLRREMLKFGVTVHTVAPWIYRTGINYNECLHQSLKENWRRSPQHVTEDYGEDFLEESFDFIDSLYSDYNASQIVRDMIEATVGEYPKINYEEGSLWIPKLLSYLPPQFLDYYLYFYSPRRINHKHSQTALGAVKERFNLNPLAVHMRSNISVYNQHICLSGIRDHCGKIGNERANQLAKCAASDIGDYDYNKYPISCMKKELKNQIIEQLESNMGEQ